MAISSSCGLRKSIILCPKAESAWQKLRQSTTVEYMHILTRHKKQKAKDRGRTSGAAFHYSWQGVRATPRSLF